MQFISYLSRPVWSHRNYQTNLLFRIYRGYCATFVDTFIENVRIAFDSKEVSVDSFFAPLQCTQFAMQLFIVRWLCDNDKKAREKKYMYRKINEMVAHFSIPSRVWQEKEKEIFSANRIQFVIICCWMLYFVHAKAICKKNYSTKCTSTKIHGMWSVLCIECNHFKQSMNGINQD